jgi:hypothetical protein
MALVKPTTFNGLNVGNKLGGSSFGFQISQRRTFVGVHKRYFAQQPADTLCASFVYVIANISGFREKEYRGKKNIF